jgi:uncharacterized RDD family membrane protein YckC
LWIPTIATALLIATVSLVFSNPDALRAIRTIVLDENNQRSETDAMAAIAPLLVKIDAPGLPASVKQAVDESDYQRAGELLLPYDFDFALSVMAKPPSLPPNHIRVNIERLIPAAIRSIAVFGTAALYFTLLTARGRTGTLGKLLFGIQVVRLDGRPLTYWEGFERFGGYLASIGTFGLGLLDLWRDPNRRLAHDRISNTVVVRKAA